MTIVRLLVQNTTNEQNVIRSYIFANSEKSIGDGKVLLGSLSWAKDELLAPISGLAVKDKLSPSLTFRLWLPVEQKWSDGHREQRLALNDPKRYMCARKCHWRGHCYLWSRLLGIFLFLWFWCDTLTHNRHEGPFGRAQGKVCTASLSGKNHK